MLLAGMDVSGDNEHGNHKYLAITIGTQEKIKTTYKSFGIDNIHMQSVGKKKQSQILRDLSFDNTDIIALCIHINRKPILDRIAKMRKIRKKRIPENKIIRTYHYLLLHQIREDIEIFLQKHNFAISDIIFECDSDCRNFVKDAGLKYTEKEMSHGISDVVAWANNKNRDPKGVISIDIAQKIEKLLTARIFR
jgi:hypothetical protein